VIEWCRLALSMDSLTTAERAQYEDDLLAATEFISRQEAKRLEADDVR
jgi:hypothetical protein